MNFNKTLAIGGLAVLTAFSSVAQEDTPKEGGSNFMNTLSVGGALGLSLLHGDVRQYDYFPVTKYHSELGLGGYFHVTKTLNPVFNLQGQIYMANVNGTKRYANLYSKSSILEGSLNLQINISNLVVSGKGADRKFGSYAFVGAGLSKFRAVAYNFSDEVQSFYGYTNYSVEEKADRTTEMVFPFGVGLKYRLSSNLSLNAEISGRRLNSDKLDAIVSGVGKDRYSLTSVGATYSFGDRTNDPEWVDPIEVAIQDVNEMKEVVDGMATDTDKDGVPDIHDKEAGTPEGVAVDGAGRAIDTDGDGIPDYMDKDKFSADGAKVDEDGKEKDSDGDGVADSKDLEPNTEKGAMVNFQGVTISAENTANNLGGQNASVPSGLPSVYFNLNSSVISYQSYPSVAEVAQALKANKDLKLTVVGHTDASGSDSYNQKLGLRRAQAVVDHLVKIYGIDASRLTADSKGKSEPLASNGNTSNVNRRVDFVISK